MTVPEQPTVPAQEPPAAPSTEAPRPDGIPGGAAGDASGEVPGAPRPGFGPPPPQFGQQAQFGAQQQYGAQQQHGQQFGGQQAPYGAPPYGQPGYPPPQQGYSYGYPYGFAGQSARGTTNGMAIAAMVCGLCGFLCLVPGLVGIILGAISLPQIKREQQAGRGMAITGIVVGSLWILGFVLLLVLGHHGGQVDNTGNSGGPGTAPV